MKLEQVDYQVFKDNLVATVNDRRFVIGRSRANPKISSELDEIIRRKAIEEPETTNVENKLLEHVLIFRKKILNESVTDKIASLLLPLIPKQGYWLVAVILFAVTIIFLHLFLSFSPLTVKEYVFEEERAFRKRRFYDDISFVTFMTSWICLLWHEFGHATACKRYGLKADYIGFGIYLVLPAFFTRLCLIKLANFREKMGIYFAGVYFQLILNLLLGIVVLITDNYEVAKHCKVIFGLNTSLIIVNLIPVFRYDGYLVIREFLRNIELSNIQKQFIAISSVLLTIFFIGRTAWIFGRSAVYTFENWGSPMNTMLDYIVSFGAIALILTMLIFAPRLIRSSLTVLLR